MTTTETFNHTGAEQTWTVPDNVKEITARLYGPGGGQAWHDSSGQSGTPGTGGYLEATLPVTEGETLYLYVGGRGGDSGDGVSGSPGWNGGGSGADTIYVSSGGGGGATDLRQAGNSLSDRVLVSAGGAGASRSRFNGSVRGGYGGPNTGEPTAANADAIDGTGGTQTGGGAAGTGDSDGNSGALGVGGDGVSGFGELATGGAAAGLYGGGSAAIDGDNDIVGMSGAGSNYADGSATVIANERGTGNSGDGLIELEYVQEPGTPANLTASYSESNDEILLTWDSVSEADGYRLYRHTGPGAYDNGSVVADTTSTSYTDADLLDGVRYYYQVVAYIDGESDPSNEVDQLTNLPPVENLSVESVSGRYAMLSWTDPSDNASGYRLLLSEDDDGTYQQDGGDIAPVGEGETVTHESTELLDGQLYAATVETFTDYTSAREDQ